MASSLQKANKRSMSRRSGSGRFFFGCFSPRVADRDGGVVRLRSTHLKGSDAEQSVLAYIAFDDEGNKIDNVQRIVPYQRGCKREAVVRPQKDGTSKRLLHATKAAFLDMSLVRMVRMKRNPKKTEERNGLLCKKANRILRLMSERSEEPGISDFDVSSFSQSSFAATSLNSTGSTRSLSPGSISNSLDHGASKLSARRVSSELKCYGQDRPPVLVRKLSSSANTPTPLGLILLAMAVLIFWGKVCAIDCTSACLVFSLPSWVPQSTSSDKANDHESVDSAEYKKRIIMEGLLRRQQRPRGLQRRSSVVKF